MKKKNKNKKKREGVKPFAPSNKVCGFYLQENFSILRFAPSLNKRSDIFGHCIHRKRFWLVTCLCQLMRSPLRTETPSLDKNNYLLTYLLTALLVIDN